MKRVQVQFSEAQTRALSELATVMERPIAAVVRDAVDAWVIAQEPGIKVEDAPDLAESHDHYVNAGDLVSISEISRRSGRPANTIQSWRRRYQGFPEPVTHLAAGPIWEWDVVASWISHRSARQVHRSESIDQVATTAALPGFELVVRGLQDLNAGRDSVEGTLLRSASTRLATVGIDVPGGPLEDATSRLYALVVDQVGEARAHSRYNALRRRLSSYLHTAAPTGAQAA